MKTILLSASLCSGALMLGAFASTQGFGMTEAELFWILRAPRLLLALLAGMGLAASGVACQALMLNPLADPYVLGVSGGAALGAVLASVFGDLPAWAMIAFSIAGAFVAATLVFVTGRKRGVSVTTLLLSGVVFNAFATAVITLIKTVVSAQKAQEILFWLMGQMSVYDYTYIACAGGVTLLALAVLFIEAPRLDVLVQGDDVAQTLGVDPERVRFRVYTALTVIVGAVVALTGLIGFIGLIVPHIMRLQMGPKHRPLLVASAFVGGAMLLVADACCRLAFPVVSTELPVGVITAFVGAPYFMWALRKA
jgi:iron complex transport system permease protein